MVEIGAFCENPRIPAKTTRIQIAIVNFFIVLFLLFVLSLFIKKVMLLRIMNRGVASSVH
jgi:uncharacterized membrane protein